MRMITGLGNQQDNYLATRHNAGFWFLDALLQSAGGAWQKHKALNGCVYKWHEKNCVLFKPGMLMNINGGPIAACARYYNIPPERLCIAHDELDFTCGHVRLKTQGGHGGHNGMRDVMRHIQPATYLRLRIGIDRPVSTSDVSHYVLSKPSQEQLTSIKAAIGVCVNHIDYLLQGQVQKYQELCSKIHPAS